MFDEFQDLAKRSFGKEKYKGIDFEYGKEEFEPLIIDPTFKLFKYLEINGFQVYKIYEPDIIYNYKRETSKVFQGDCSNVGQLFDDFIKFLNEHDYKTILLKDLDFVILNIDSVLELKARISFVGF